MIRINRLTDYGIVLLTHMAAAPEGATHNARDLAQGTHLPIPAVSKVLKILSRGGVLMSARGSKGGYRLADSPARISVARVIRALEGPIAITDCTVDSGGLLAGECGQAAVCPVHGNWQRINQVVEDALDQISLKDMVRTTTPPCTPIVDFEATLAQAIR